MRMTRTLAAVLTFFAALSAGARVAAAEPRPPCAVPTIDLERRDVDRTRLLVVLELRGSGKSVTYEAALAALAPTLDRLHLVISPPPVVPRPAPQDCHCRGDGAQLVLARRDGRPFGGSDHAFATLRRQPQVSFAGPLFVATHAPFMGVGQVIDLARAPLSPAVLQWVRHVHGSIDPYQRSIRLPDELGLDAVALTTALGCLAPELEPVLRTSPVVVCY